MFPTAMHIAIAARDRRAPRCPRVTQLRDDARREGDGVRGHRQDRPHAPAGRDAAHARPGDLRLGRAARSRRSPRSRATLPALLRARARRHRGRHRASTRTPSTRCASRAKIAELTGPPVRHRAEQVRGARRARRARRCHGALKTLATRADEDRQRRALARERAALRPRRADASPRTSRAARSCRARSTRRSARR